MTSGILERPYEYAADATSAQQKAAIAAARSGAIPPMAELITAKISSFTTHSQAVDVSAAS